MRLCGLWVGCVFLIVMSGCTHEPSLSPAEREVVSAHVGDQPPSPTHSLDVTFGDAIRLLGYDVDARSWASDGSLGVTWYWQVLETPGSGVRLATFSTSEVPAADVELDSRSDVRRLHGPSRWQRGQYITDSEELVLPSDWRANTATLRVGVFEGVLPVPVTSGGADHEDRAVGPTVDVFSTVPSVRSGGPRLDVMQAPTAPRIDGSLSDAAWAEAHSTQPFIGSVVGGRRSVHATAKALWDPRYLYLGFEVRDPALRVRSEAVGSQDAEASVGLLIDPSGTGSQTYEVRVSAGGNLVDARLDRNGAEQAVDHGRWKSGARVASSLTDALDDRAPGAAGYSVEIALPWQAFRSARLSDPAPSVGDRWRADLYVVDVRGDRRSMALWWSREAPGSRRPDRFGILAFRGPLRGVAEPRGTVALPPDRAKDAKTREEARDLGVRDALIKRRVQKRRHPGEPPAFQVAPESAPLESGETPH